MTDVNPAQAVTDDWGDTAGTAQYSDIEGGDWGWGETSGGSGGYYDGPFNDPENPETCWWYYLGFLASIAPATEGGDVVISFSPNWENNELTDLALEMWIEDVSAVDGLDYASSNWHTWEVAGLHSGGEGAPPQYTIATIDDAIEETTQSFKVHIRMYGYPETEIVLEADIFDNDLGASAATLTAQAAPAVEGTDVLLLVAADAELQFEYFVADVTAVSGTDYSGPQDWTLVGPDGQAAIPTFVRAGDNGSRSISIWVQVVGRPDTAIQLEGDILDREDVVVQSVGYAYDIFNRLVRRTFDADGHAGAGAATERFFSWEDNQIVFQFDGPQASNLTHRYVWNPLATDQILADENALNEVLWPLADHLGTARDLATYNSTTNETTIVNHRVYDSYGKLISQTDDGFTLAFGFTGCIFEAATGLQYNRNRWYDAATGRWISEDPIGFSAGDGNLSRYVGNSPLSWVDPSGLITPGDGHHLVSQSLWAGMSDDVQRVFNASNARIHDDFFRFHDSNKVNGVTHRCYINEVRKELTSFLGDRSASMMTTDDARTFLNRIVTSTNPNIANFNAGVLSEMFAARTAGKDAFEAALKSGVGPRAAKQAAIAEAQTAVLKTRSLINNRAKRLFGRLCRFVPFVGAGMVLFATGSAHAAGREAFLELTGLDNARDIGELLGVGFDEIQRQLDEASQQVHDDFGFNPLNP